MISSTSLIVSSRGISHSINVYAIDRVIICKTDNLLSICINYFVPG